MKKILLLLVTLLMMCCSTPTQIPVETIINYKDSVITNVIDSVVYIPKERIVDVVAQYDTLTMETDMAKAEAYVDTSLHILKGKLENKKGVQYKYIYKDKIQWRDSLVYKEVPVEVTKEVVKYRHTFWDKLSWLISGLALSILIIYVLKKIYVR